MKLRSLLSSALITLAIWPSIASAQFSDGYNFLKAVKDKDGTKATEIISKPGSTIVNTHDASNGQTALHIVVDRRDLTWVGFLLAKGADVNSTDSRGTTPLMLATNIRFLEGAQLLLEHGAQIDKANDSGETPLIRAVQLRDLPMIRLLISKGANPNKADTLAGMSARDYAMRDRRSQVIVDILDNAKGESASSKAVQGPVF